jgi:hypothetical protein
MIITVSSEFNNSDEYVIVTKLLSFISVSLHNYLTTLSHLLRF